jgi:hypothetical protein
MPADLDPDAEIRGAALNHAPGVCPIHQPCWPRLQRSDLDSNPCPAVDAGSLAHIYPFVYAIDNARPIQALPQPLSTPACGRSRF